MATRAEGDTCPHCFALEFKLTDQPEEPWTRSTYKGTEANMLRKMASDKEVVKMANNFPQHARFRVVNTKTGKVVAERAPLGAPLAPPASTLLAPYTRLPTYVTPGTLGAEWVEREFQRTGRYPTEREMDEEFARQEFAHRNRQPTEADIRERIAFKRQQREEREARVARLQERLSGLTEGLDYATSGYIEVPARRVPSTIRWLRGPNAGKEESL